MWHASRQAASSTKIGVGVAETIADAVTSVARARGVDIGVDVDTGIHATAIARTAPSIRRSRTRFIPFLSIKKVAGWNIPARRMIA